MREVVVVGGGAGGTNFGSPCVKTEAPMSWQDCSVVLLYCALVAYPWATPTS